MGFFAKGSNNQQCHPSEETQETHEMASHQHEKPQNKENGEGVGDLRATYAISPICLTISVSSF
jgi:hypothetical protein